MTLYRQLCYSESYHIWTLDCSLVYYQCANISLSSNNEPLIYKQWANARTMSHLTSHSEPLLYFSNNELSHLLQWATNFTNNEPQLEQWATTSPTVSHYINNEPPHFQQWATNFTNNEPQLVQWATTSPTVSHCINNEPPHLQQWATAWTMSHHISNNEPLNLQTTSHRIKQWTFNSVCNASVITLFSNEILTFF